jgi:hypothetical protein
VVAAGIGTGAPEGEHVVDGEVVGPDGADEAEDEVGAGALDDEAEVEVRPLLECLDPVEDGGALPSLNPPAKK